MTLKESSNDRPTPGTLVWRANHQSHTHANTKRLQQTPVCVWTERMPIWTIQKTFCFLSAVRISQKSDRNQSCTQDPFQHEIIKLSSSFTSSLGSCRLLMIVSLSISKSRSNLWQKRQYVSTFLLVNNVSSFYQTISALIWICLKIYTKSCCSMRIQYRSLVRPSTSRTWQGPLKKIRIVSMFLWKYFYANYNQEACV